MDRFDCRGEIIKAHVDGRRYWWHSTDGWTDTFICQLSVLYWSWLFTAHYADLYSMNCSNQASCATFVSQHFVRITVLQVPDINHITVEDCADVVELQSQPRAVASSFFSQLWHRKIYLSAPNQNNRSHASHSLCVCIYGRKFKLVWTDVINSPNKYFLKSIPLHKTVLLTQLFCCVCVCVFYRSRLSSFTSSLRVQAFLPVSC